MSYKAPPLGYTQIFSLHEVTHEHILCSSSISAVTASISTCSIYIFLSLLCPAALTTQPRRPPGRGLGSKDLYPQRVSVVPPAAVALEAHSLCWCSRAAAGPSQAPKEVVHSVEVFVNLFLRCGGCHSHSLKTLL